MILNFTGKEFFGTQTKGKDMDNPKKVLTSQKYDFCLL